MKKIYSKIQGNWDLIDVPYKLGNAIQFYVQLTLLAKNADISEIFLNIIFDRNSSIEANRRINEQNYLVYVDHIKIFFSYFSDIRQVTLNETPMPDALLFPDSHREKIFQFNFKSYIYLEHLVSRSHVFSIKKQIEIDAKYFLKNRNINKFITVHLKYDKIFKIESNAILDIWIESLNQIIFSHQNLSLIMIGSDDLPANYQKIIKQIPRTFQTKGFLDSAAQEFILILNSLCFLGVASGPSNIAINSDLPYLVFKHTEDAWNEQFEEIYPGEKKLKFSGNNQQYIIGNENIMEITQFIARLNS